MTTDNPLKQYFRQPAIYIRLPSGGTFYPPGTLDMPPNQELPVYPMTAIDEITYRTPDALFNGSAVISVIQSCLPSIRDAWAMPATDVDTVLIAIRIASYGHNMDFETACPKCGHTHEQSCDLRMVMDSIKSPDYNQTLNYGDMQLFFRPLSYKNVNENNQTQFDEQKILQMLPDATISDAEKMQALSDAMKKITEMTVKTLAQSIVAIKTPTATVNQPEYIKELLQNCDSSLFAKIREHITTIRTDSEMKPFDIVCPECQHEYKQSITLDMSSFFEPAS
jgi:T4 bacteriophage base plate protein